MRLRAKEDCNLPMCANPDGSKIKELTKDKLYTGTIHNADNGEIVFICYNDNEEWRTYDIDYFEPKEIAEGV